MSELNIEVLFESWLIWDENYPLLKKNDKLKIALLASELSITPANKKDFLTKKIDPATYEFSGKCIYIDSDKKDQVFVVLDTGLLKFYLYYPSYDEFTVGEFYYGKVSLMVDYFMWKESYQELPDAPDIIYDFKIGSILKSLIYDEFILDEDGIVMQPTTLSSSNCDNIQFYEVDKMEIGEDMREFFLLKLIPKISNE